MLNYYLLLNSYVETSYIANRYIESLLSLCGWGIQQQVDIAMYDYKNKQSGYPSWSQAEGQWILKDLLW